MRVQKARLLYPFLPHNPLSRHHSMADFTALVATLKNHPVCTGVLPVKNSDLTLYYGTISTARRISFANASPDDLDHLANSCTAATFGLNKEDVLDESYRKAGKMDPEEFAIKFDLANSGLLDIVATELLEGNEAVNGLEYELYNLNVYGEGSFFKVHRDTPRSDMMLGSLVLVFPSLHTGGILMMRHGGQEWTFDSGALLRDATSPAIGYAAFFSDVEHEVLPVTAGHRVTITYNLYYPRPRKELTPFSTPDISRSPFFASFSALLSDPSFIPEGCAIGFGLSHKYPVSENTELSDITQRLKCQDAIIYAACRALKLEPRLCVVYDCEEDGQVLCDCFADLYMLEMEGNMAEFLKEEYKGEAFFDVGYTSPEERIVWVTPPTDYTRIQQNYVVYGNSAEVATQYADVCLIAKLPPSSYRANILEAMNAAGSKNE